MFKDGQLVDLQPDEKNRAKDLIADLMIATNGATARFLVDKGFPSLRRFLQSPRRWDRIVALAASHGVTLPALPDAVALDRFLTARRAADPAGFADLSLAVVKMLGSGEYAAAPARRVDERTGPLRPGRQRLRAFDGAEPALSRPGDAAPAQGGAGR